MSQPAIPQERQLALVADALRGAISNLTVALQLIGSLRAPAPEEPQQDEEKPKHFGRGAGVRPTAASKAEPPQSEG